MSISSLDQAGKFPAATTSVDPTLYNKINEIITAVNTATPGTATGTGSTVLQTSPTLITPVLGVAAATSINKMAVTAPATSSTLAVADGKTLTANKTLTLDGTDATTQTFPATSATIARTDAGQTFTGVNTLTASILAGINAVSSLNYIASETGANNAIVGTFTGAPALAAGLRVTVKLAHTLQAGANTFNYNGGGVLNIKKHTNAATDLSVAYASTGIIELIYDGTEWLDLSQ